MREKKITRKVAWLTFVEVDFWDDVELDGNAVDLPPEVVVDELLVRRMKAESRRELHSVDSVERETEEGDERERDSSSKERSGLPNIVRPR